MTQDFQIKYRLTFVTFTAQFSRESNEKQTSQKRANETYR